MLHGGEAEGTPQVVGDEGGVAVVLRQLVLVDGEHEQIAEVEVARLEDAHDLQSDGGLAVERNAGGTEQAAEQADEGGGGDAELATLGEREQAVDERVGLEQRLAVELAVHVAAGVGVGIVAIERRHIADDGVQPAADGGIAILRTEHKRQQRVAPQVGRRHAEAVALGEFAVEGGCHGAELLDVGMTQHGSDVAVGVGGTAGVVALGLQGGEHADESRDGSARQREAHGDVDAADLVRQRVEHGLQQCLVAQHDGILLLVMQLVEGGIAGIGCGDMDAAIPLRDVACLRVLGGCGDIAHGLLAAHHVEALLGQTVGKLLHVAHDEFASLAG